MCGSRKEGFKGLSYLPTFYRYPDNVYNCLSVFSKEYSTEISPYSILNEWKESEPYYLLE